MMSYEENGKRESPGKAHVYVDGVNGQAHPDHWYDNVKVRFVRWEGDRTGSSQSSQSIHGGSTPERVQPAPAQGIVPVHKQSRLLLLVVKRLLLLRFLLMVGIMILGSRPSGGRFRMVPGRGKSAISTRFGEGLELIQDPGCRIDSWDCSQLQLVLG